MEPQNTTTATSPASHPKESQYSIRTILWMTTAVALLVAHARSLGPTSIELLLACAIFWIVSAALFSLISRDPQEVLFWSALIVVQGFLAVSAVRVFGFSQSCGWGMMGAVCGGFCGARLFRSSVWGSLVSGVLGGLSMLTVLRYFHEPMGMEQWLDFFGAVCVGCMLWHFVNFMRWFLVKSGQSRLIMAAWLTLSVLAGNWLVALSGY